MKRIARNNLSIRHSRGVSLIELMIALVIGTLLLLGIVQVFSGSSNAFRANEANSRIQEAGRFALEFLRRDLRMAGHLGCSNDRARFDTFEGDAVFFSTLIEDGDTLDSAPFPVRHHIAIQGFEANDSAPTDVVELPTTVAVGGADDWTPPLPGEILGLAGGVVRGSDILVVRYFSPESIASVDGSTFTMNASTSTVSLSINQAPFPVAASQLYGIADCQGVRLFQANTAGLPGTINITHGGGLNRRGLPAAVLTNSLRSMFRAEAVVFYVGVGVNGEPSLYRAEMGIDGVLVGAEIVEGVENMQVLYGYDPNLSDVNQNYLTATEIEALTALTPLRRWMGVGSVKVGLVVRSPTRSDTPAAVQNPQVLGTQFTPLEPTVRLRKTYEGTIALRNRIRAL